VEIRIKRFIALVILAPLSFCTAAIAASTWDVHPTPLDRMNTAGIGLSVAAVAEVLREGQDSELRYWSALALAQLEDAAAIPILIQATDDADLNVRTGASIALGYFPTHESAQALRIIARRDPEFVTRKAAVISLGRIRNGDAALGLIEAANDENESEEIRYHAIYTLGEFADSETLMEINPLTDSSNANIKAITRLSMSKGGVPIEIGDLVQSATDIKIDEFTFLQLVKHLEQKSNREFFRGKDAPIESQTREKTKQRILDWWSESTGIETID